MTTDDYGAGFALAWIFIFLPIILIFALAGYVLTSWFLMKIFEKAGVQGKWRAWVPLYNTLIFAKLGDLNPWWLLILWGGGIVLSWVPGTRQPHLPRGLHLHAPRRVARGPEAAEGSRLAHPVLLHLDRLVRHQRLRQVALEHGHPGRAVGRAASCADTTVWQGIPVQTPAGGFPANPVTQPGAGTRRPRVTSRPAGYQPPAAPAARPRRSADDPAAAAPRRRARRASARREPRPPRPSRRRSDPTLTMPLRPFGEGASAAG